MLVAVPEQSMPFFQPLAALLTVEGSDVQDMQDHKIIQAGKEDPWRLLVLPSAQGMVSWDSGQVTLPSAEKFTLQTDDFGVQLHVQRKPGERNVHPSF